MADIPSTNQDDLAAEWERSLGGAKSADDVADDLWETSETEVTKSSSASNDLLIDRILNQDEIDNLLGFSIEDQTLDGTGGVRTLVDSGTVSYERLPMLEIVFDRMVRLLTSSLRNFFSDNVEVTLNGITSVRFGDYLASIPLPAVLNVFKADPWDNFGIVTVDSSLIYLVIDVLLGGRRGHAAIRVDGRPYTTIEISLVRRMLDIVLADAEKAFEPISPVKFSTDRIETNPRFASISRPANAAILIELHLDIEGRGGRVEILLPYATIEPIRDMLLQSFMGEKFGRDPIWEEHLATEIWQAKCDIEAVLYEAKLPLRSVMDLKVGDTLMFDLKPDPMIQMRCGDQLITQGRMGRLGDHIAVQVARPLKRSRTTFSMFEQSTNTRRDA
ncbi:MAG: flagellar motor switch protein FliM [Beijerinckiaceae bacterium]|nr:flagellar motor switch protein FliM [Beijerinckiaceae bacterium]